ncbi:MAG: lysozyme, partial [Ruminococcus sp.]
MKKVKRFIAVMVSTVMLLMLAAYFPVSAVTSADLTISQNGIEFICSLEGFHSTCYSDYSQSSIGFGTKCNGSSVQPHASGLHSITREQAMIDMKAEIENSYIPNVRRQTSGISMNQNQFDALVSLTYNCGGGTTLIKNSPLVKYLRGELSESEARSQYSSYIVTAGGKVLQGLINRRNKEADLFFSG